MRKVFFLSLACLSFSFFSKAQYVTIPDANLQARLQQLFPTCFDASGQMDTTCSGIINATRLDLSYINITNWDGIQYFDNLYELSVGGQITTLPTIPPTVRKFTLDGVGNTLTTLPQLPDFLTDLAIRSCRFITSLPPWPNSLVRLEYSEGMTLTSMPVFPNTLRYLNCRHNRLMSLPNIPIALDSLDCSFNDSITVLPALPNTLKYLTCQVNRITSLGTSLPPGLTYLMFNYNQVSFLPTLPNGLVTLAAVRNQLTAVPAFPSSLLSISLDVNSITSIPALPPSLQWLGVEGNQLTSLPALPNTITSLSCGSNLLTSLPVLPTSLTRMLCYFNQLTSLPSLTNTLLEDLECRGNLLISLPTLPPTLTVLGCESNHLASLPTLPAGITRIRCENNELTYLPELPQSLNDISCYNNLIRCLPVLPHNFVSITMDNRIGCMPNQPGNYVFTVKDTATNTTTYYAFGTGQNHFPLCSVINNIYHCNAFPVMAGHVYNDNNNNNIKDANEPYRANIKVSLSNGEFVTTDANGVYQLVADSIGAYSITCTPPNYFASVPPSYNYNFSDYDSLIVNDFALQATQTVDSVSILVTPQRLFARIGFPMPYDISYENAGTTILTPVIHFNYPNTQLVYDSSSNATVINNGTDVQLNETAMVPGERKSFTAYFHVSTAATFGDSIHVNAVISANAVSNTDSAVNQIRGPYDPNDKSATAILPPDQVIAGKYIDYTVRFQNTGNDTAFNVVITDTLSSYLLASSLQTIGSSHPCKTTVNGNVVSFEFLNIQLPDSNVNELKSHGYVSFKIKPQPSVVMNTSIPNKAAIYFDYNLPVITNTATTEITNFAPVPLKLLSFNAVAGLKNKATVYWTTSNEYNINGFVIECSIDGRNYTAIAAEVPKSNMYNSYAKEVGMPAAKIVYYRLKINDIDGRFYYGPVVSLKTNNETNGISLLNNPVKDVLNIAVTDASLKNTMARIISVQGAVVKTIYLTNDIETINIGNLSAGSYILETRAGSMQFVITR